MTMTIFEFDYCYYSCPHLVANFSKKKKEKKQSKGMIESMNLLY